MTVICWDGKTLAADKRACVGGTLIRTTTKIFRLDRPYICLAGYSGEFAGGEELLAWFKAGCDADKFPAVQRSSDGWTGLLVIHSDGAIWKYEKTPYPMIFPPQHFAIGSGRDFALMAMHLGKTAREAVELTCHFDGGCGNGVDALEFDE